MAVNQNIICHMYNDTHKNIFKTDKNNTLYDGQRNLIKTL